MSMKKLEFILASRLKRIRADQLAQQIYYGFIAYRFSYDAAHFLLFCLFCFVCVFF